jgi:hypothetical protein
MHVIALLFGLALWLAASCLLVEDAIHSGHWSTQHLLSPLLTLATATAGIYCHRRLATLRLLSASGFTLVAVFGSALVVYSTTGRTAANSDARQAGALAVHSVAKDKREELATARITAKAECKSGFGTRCTNATARVDALTTELAALRPGSIDPRGDALAKLATLLGQDGERVRAIASAVDPWALPVWLELASIVFLSAAFPHRRKKVFTPANGFQLESVENVGKAFTKEQALLDFRTMRSSGSQRFLADRWQVSEGCVSKWLRQWEDGGAIDRQRLGKHKAALALPLPR